MIKLSQKAVNEYRMGYIESSAGGNHTYMHAIAPLFLFS